MPRLLLCEKRQEASLEVSDYYENCLIDVPLTPDTSADKASRPIFTALALTFADITTSVILKTSLLKNRTLR
jgi:hypothetical protein